MNKKLKILAKSFILRPEDILAITNYMINLDYGNDFKI
jgi:hypothetical protein